MLKRIIPKNPIFLLEPGTIPPILDPRRSSKNGLDPRTLPPVANGVAGVHRR
ncbi:hypothetical protein [Genomoviridae sp.]|nr:hypothetical protein [Genomoviridae sp.]